MGQKSNATQTPSSSGLVTITYIYDTLYRLTEANYSTGDYYHYTYDAVGNRLTQETMVAGQMSNVGYLYDDANRLASVDGVTYTFDANGNLLSDGVNTYVYDSANRLTSVNGAMTYQYNGLGDRISQTVNGVTTNYTLDLNTGLTQVLSDGTTDYLYGNGRIAQVNTTTEYFLGDALGSVRQMTDANGVITFARGYDPYGVVTYTTGASHTEFGFTGEQYSASTELLYLRARHYSPADGRFTSRDTWSGDVNRPLSLNRWMYAYANPVRFVDPSGHYNRQAAVAFALTHDLNDKFPDDGYYDFPTYKDNQCTMFVSSALSMGGYPTSKEWPGYEGTKLDEENYNDDYNSFYFYRLLRGEDYEHAWINTPNLYHYLKQNNDELVPPTVDFASTDWESWLQQNQSIIERGDVVFYKFEGSGVEWSHAAMVVGWGSRTHYGVDYAFERHTFYASLGCAQRWEDSTGLNTLRPLVVERSGSIQYASARSVDNTASRVEKISIMRIR